MTPNTPAGGNAPLPGSHDALATRSAPVETLGPTGRALRPCADTVAPKDEDAPKSGPTDDPISTPTQSHRRTQLAVRSTPAALGYRMPAEWEPHAATWLAWPHNTTTWPDQLAQVQDIFLRMIAAVQEHETVHLLVNDAATAAQVGQQLHVRGVTSTRVVMHQWRTADTWLRDSGPIFVTAASGASPPVALNDWEFNAWGGKYDDLLPDNDLPRQIAVCLGVPRFTPGIVLEGGSIDVNGRGCCLTTEQCLLNPNRNPHLQRPDIERYLRDYLGVHQVVWLGQGIAGDDTDGHVDDIARFVNPTTVVCGLEEDPQDPNYAVLHENYQRLQAAT